MSQHPSTAGAAISPLAVDPGLLQQIVLPVCTNMRNQAGSWWQGLGRVAHPLQQRLCQKEVQRD